MPYAPSNGARLYYEEAGTGHPIIWVREFGADHREWEDQMRFFSREYRCIAYAARGYPPSDVPEEKALYGQEQAAFRWEADLRRMTVPTLLAVGDEDWPCIETNIFLKTVLPNAGLWIQPRTGHAINLEEPMAFNRTVQDFFSTVERGRWSLDATG